MKQPNHLVVIPLIAVVGLVTACGGGGDEGDSISKSQDDVELVSLAGMSVVTLSAQRTLWGLVHPLTVAREVSLQVQGSGEVALTCVSGSGSARLQKAGVYPGLAVGDRVDFTYRDCTNARGVTLNGSFSVLPLHALDHLVGTVNSTVPANVRVEAPTAFRYSTGAETTSIAGTADLQTAAIATGQRIVLNASVPAGAQLVTTVPSPFLQFNLSEGTQFSLEWSAVLPFSFGLKGRARVSATGSSIALYAETVGPLVGGTFAGERPYQPLGGTLLTTSQDPRVSSRMTFSGNMVHVEGDTDLNGTADLVLDLPLDTLLKP